MATQRPYGQIVPLLFDLLSDAPTSGQPQAPQFSPNPEPPAPRKPWETEPGSGGTNDHAGEPGYDVNGDKLPESNLPVGWVVNPKTGALIPPGTGAVAGSGIPVGALFGVGGDVWQWNGRSITEASVAEAKGFSGPRIDPTAENSGMTLGGTGASAEGISAATGSSGYNDPYAGEANARANAAAAEAVRARRIAEVQDAADAMQQRVQQAQQARLAGAQYSLTPDMTSGPNAGYFPAFGPSSPLVRTGLIDPMRFTAQSFDPERGVNQNEAQIAKDLQMIRSIAGYGG